MTAGSLTKSMPDCLAKILANVVLPVQAAPQRIIEVIRPAATRRPIGLSGARRWSWPTIPPMLSGRSRSASGRSAAPSNSDASSTLPAMRPSPGLAAREAGAGAGVGGHRVRRPDGGRWPPMRFSSGSWLAATQAAARSSTEAAPAPGCIRAVRWLSGARRFTAAARTCRRAEQFTVAAGHPDPFPGHDAAIGAEILHRYRIGEASVVHLRPQSFAPSLCPAPAGGGRAWRAGAKPAKDCRRILRFEADRCLAQTGHRRHAP